MTVLTILGIIAAFLILMFAISRLNNHCNAKFSYNFINKTSFSLAALSTLGISFGYGLYRKALISEGDILNGIVIFIIGAIITVILIYINFKKTNIAYGIGGTAIQIGLFVPLAFLGMLFIVIGLVLNIVYFFYAKPVFVINK
jgi:hypothetical protein